VISSRPFILRALYEWIVEANNMTPQIVCDATVENCEFPDQFVEDDRITFNISPIAVKDLHISNEDVTFDASFDGEVQSIYAPMASVMAIYPLETGDGIVFDDGEPGGPPEAKPKKQKPKLRIVKSDRD